MERVLFDFGIVRIYWYSVMILLGVLVASFLIFREAKREGLNQDIFLNLIFGSVIVGLIGARLYYVGFNWSYYQKYPIEILQVWNGGLAIHGGIIFGSLWVLRYCAKHKLDLLKTLDISVVGLIIAQAIGRWGNFFNQEAYGGIVTKESLSYLPEFIRDGMLIDGNYRQPCFLYESIWNIAGFIIMIILRKSKLLKKGVLTGFYLIWYSAGRIVIETMRTDSLMLGNIKVAYILSTILIIIGIITIVKNLKGSRFDNLYHK